MIIDKYLNKTHKCAYLNSQTLLFKNNIIKYIETISISLHKTRYNK